MKIKLYINTGKIHLILNVYTQYANHVPKNDIEAS